MPRMIHIPVAGEIKTIEATDDDDAFAKVKVALDDGHLELMPYTVHPGMAMLLDGDGQMKNLVPNLRATVLQGAVMRGNVILGDAVLISRTGPELGSCPLTLDEVDRGLAQLCS